MSRPYRLRRSCHAVPGASARMLARARELPADLVFLDLEDSVAPAAKAAARGEVAAALLAGPFRAPAVAVRVNAVGGAWCHRDLIEVVGAAAVHVDVVILPKVAGPEQVAFADHLLTGLEREAGLEPGRIGLEAQIEDAAGLVAVEHIAAACPARLEALVFGPGDFAASVGMPTTTIGAAASGAGGHELSYALSRILVAARAAGVQAIDGPYARLRDPEGLLASARAARALGYDGKWSIHPDQIATLNEVFGVAQDELDRADGILRAYARALDQEGRGAAVHEGEMIDEATRRMAWRVAERGRLAGLRPNPGDG